MNARTAFAVMYLAASSALAQEPGPAVVIDSDVPIVAAAACRDGTQIVGTGADDILRVWSVPPDRPIVVPIGAHIAGFACSRDGRWIAVATGKGIVALVDRDQRAIVQRLTVTDRFIGAMAFSPEGALLAVTTDAGPPQLWDVKSGMRIAILHNRFGGSSAVAFSPDGARIATADEDTMVRIYDRRGKLLREVDAGPLEPMAAAFTGDGARVIVAGIDRTLITIDVATGEKGHRTPEQPDPIFALMALGDGNRFAELQLDEYTLKPAAIQLWDSRSGEFRAINVAAADVLTAGAGKTGLVLVLAPGDKKKLHVRTLQ